MTGSESCDSHAKFLSFRADVVAPISPHSLRVRVPRHNIDTDRALKPVTDSCQILYLCSSSLLAQICSNFKFSRGTTEGSGWFCGRKEADDI